MRGLSAKLLRLLGIGGGALLSVVSCVTSTAVEYRPGGAGMIIPLYIYPEDARGRLPRSYDAVAKLARSRPELQIIAVINPADGPGEERDPNYRRAVRALSRAGVVLAGYVPWGYGSRDQAAVIADVGRWERLYPGMSGIFVDEFPATTSRSRWNRELEPRVREIWRRAKEAGYSAVIANPGTPVPLSYYESGLLDLIVVHEGPRWPEQPSALGPALLPDSRRRSAVLIYGATVWDPERFRSLADTVGYLFVNDFDRDMAGIRSYEWSHLPDNLREQAQLIVRESGGY